MAHRPSQLAIDSETTGLAWTDTAFGVSFAWYENKRGGEGIIPILCSGYIDIRYASELWDNVKTWIKEAQPTLIFHNAKYDQHKLGIYPQADKFEDTCLQVYLINEHHPKSLKVLASKVLKEDTDEAVVLKEARRKLKLKASDGYDKLPLDVLVPYAQKDAEFTLRLFVRLQRALEEIPSVENVYQLEKELLLCVAGTERKGMAVNVEYVRAKIIELGDQIIQLEREIATIVGKPIGDGKTKIKIPDGKYKTGRLKFRTEGVNEFNPNSPAQILSFLQAAGEDITTTDKTALEGLEHPLAKALTNLRAIQKVRSTYLIPMLEESVDEVLHPNFNLTSTKTKRFSSSGATDG